MPNGSSSEHFFLLFLRTESQEVIILCKLYVVYPCLGTFESIVTEHIICADKLVMAPKFYYSLAKVCYVLTKSFNFQKYEILIVICICMLIGYLVLDN